MRLVGYDPSIKLELTFTAAEVLQLYYGSKMHYDGRCKDATQQADEGKHCVNGLITKLWMFRLQDPEGRFINDPFSEGPVALLLRYYNANATDTLSTDEVDLLCKVTEQFGLISTLPKTPDGFNMGCASRLAYSLRRALHTAGAHYRILQEQEVLRREGAKEDQPV